MYRTDSQEHIQGGIVRCVTFKVGKCVNSSPEIFSIYITSEGKYA